MLCTYNYDLHNSDEASKFVSLEKCKKNLESFDSFSVFAALYL